MNLEAVRWHFTKEGLACRILTLPSTIFPEPHTCTPISVRIKLLKLTPLQLG